NALFRCAVGQEEDTVASKASISALTSATRGLRLPLLGFGRPRFQLPMVCVVILVPSISNRQEVILLGSYSCLRRLARGKVILGGYFAASRETCTPFMKNPPPPRLPSRIWGPGDRFYNASTSFQALSIVSRM